MCVRAWACACARGHVRACVGISATGPGGIPWGGHAFLPLCGLGQRPPGVHSGPCCCRLACRATASRRR
eukprot:6986615-Alexandrium_andersonii.AAC.1